MDAFSMAEVDGSREGRYIESLECMLEELSYGA